jgi:hypothetical protein
MIVVPLTLARRRADVRSCGGCRAPVESAPRIYVPFFLASLGLGATAGAVLGGLALVRLTGTWGWVHRPSVWAHAYVQAFGFLALFVMGFAYHALPRFFQAPLGHPSVVRWTFWLQAGGVTAAAVSFVLAPERTWGVRVVASAALLLAAALFALAVVATVRPRTVPAQRIEPWIVAGAGWLVAGSLLALLGAATDDVAAHHALWPVMLYGFGGCWVLGFGRRLFPASLGWQPAAPWVETAAFALYQLGVASWSAGAWPAPSGPLVLVRAVGASALLLAVPLQSIGMGLWGRRREGWKSADRDYERYVYAAWAWLAVGLAFGPGLSLASAAELARSSVLIDDFARHAFALGFLSQLLMGVAGAFVPVFAGERLWSRRAHRAAFWLLNASVALRGLQVVAATAQPGVWPLIALSAPPAVAAFLLFALNLFLVVWPRRAGQPGRRPLVR